MTKLSTAALLLGMTLIILPLMAQAQQVHPKKIFQDVASWPTTAPGRKTKLKNFSPFRAVYDREYKQGMCNKCHGSDGSGSSRGPDLTDATWYHCDGTSNGIRKVLVSGISKADLHDKSRPHAMNPATNLITDDAAISALAEYVMSLGKQ